MAAIRPTRFAHVVYRTHRFQEMLSWYEAVFDARVQHQNPIMAFLTYDEEHHRFAFINLDLLKPESAEKNGHGLIGTDHVAYTYGSLNDLLGNYAQLKARGIRPYWCVHHGVTVSLYYADPDGNQMEFQVECFDSKEKANAYMSGVHFTSNPIGIEFDPEDWLARLSGGAPPSEFLTRRTDEPASPIRGALGN